MNILILSPVSPLYPISGWSIVVHGDYQGLKREGVPLVCVSVIDVNDPGELREHECILCL